MKYTIKQYLRYQDLIKMITTNYLYIGDYKIDKGTQFLWRRIYLSNGETINFPGNDELIDYLNDNYVTEIKFVDGD
jgi:hypothetical protein